MYVKNNMYNATFLATDSGKYSTETDIYLSFVYIILDCNYVGYVYSYEFGLHSIFVEHI